MKSRVIESFKVAEAEMKERVSVGLCDLLCVRVLLLSLPLIVPCLACTAQRRYADTQGQLF